MHLHSEVPAIDQERRLRGLRSAANGNILTRVAQLLSTGYFLRCFRVEKDIFISDFDMMPSFCDEIMWRSILFFLGGCWKVVLGSG